MMIGFVGMIIVITPQKILRRTVEEKFQFLNKENLSLNAFIPSIS